MTLSGMAFIAGCAVGLVGIVLAGFALRSGTIGSLVLAGFFASCGAGVSAGILARTLFGSGPWF